MMSKAEKNRRDALSQKKYYARRKAEGYKKFYNPDGTTSWRQVLCSNKNCPHQRTTPIGKPIEKVVSPKKRKRAPRYPWPASIVNKSSNEKAYWRYHNDPVYHAKCLANQRIINARRYKTNYSSKTITLEDQKARVEKRRVQQRLWQRTFRARQQERDRDKIAQWELDNGIKL